ncbi:MAG TPA: hypothetical protein VHG93_03660, partial [Longimicrobium sp.]|nr:hypothetical protein [Longimicrobium sp.]
LPDSLPALAIPTLDAARRGPGAGGPLAGAALRAMAAACGGDAGTLRAEAARIARGGDSATAALLAAHAALAAGEPVNLERLAARHAGGLPEAHARWVAAELARRDGLHQEAYRLYASIPVDLEYANFPYYAPAELRMGELAEGLGNTEAAARHYRRFVQAWKDAEPALRPRVEHARRRLAVLDRR